ncbi:MAG TPA: PilX N-terminal domain-containing pilus assembly protein [Ramlibacter sp.]
MNQRRFVPRAPRPAQSGVTLVMTLIFLVVLAMLGTWAASNNVLQERMAGNTRNRDVALQAAEAALKDAELTIATWRTQTFDGTQGLYAWSAATANDRAYWQDPARWTTYRAPPSGSLERVAAAPKYVVEKMPNTPNASDPSVFDVENYRVTARAVGADASALVILQTIIQYTP